MKNEEPTGKFVLKGLENRSVSGTEFYDCVLRHD